jgi:hypothetical protein
MTDSDLPLFTLECESTDPDRSSPRACQLLGLISAPDRDDYWLARVDPPFAGARPGENDPISEVIIATKFVGQTVFDTRSYIPVYVARVLEKSAILKREILPNQIEVMLLGLLWPKSRATME